MGSRVGSFVTGKSQPDPKNRKIEREAWGEKTSVNRGDQSRDRHAIRWTSAVKKKSRRERPPIKFTFPKNKFGGGHPPVRIRKGKKTLGWTRGKDDMWGMNGLSENVYRERRRSLCLEPVSQKPSKRGLGQGCGREAEMGFHWERWKKKKKNTKTAGAGGPLFENNNRGPSKGWSQ